MNAAILLMVLAATPANAPRPQPGEPARPFSLHASTGNTVQLSDYLGKKTIVMAFFPKAFTGG